MLRKLCSSLLIFAIILSLAVSAFAADIAALRAAEDDTAKYVYNIVKNPQVSSIGGDWAILGLARSNYSVPEQYYRDYYSTVAKYVKDCGGVLHDKKYTEYSRVILSLTAAGFDPRNVGGYDLTMPLGDFEKTIWQGTNGPIFALIALDSGGYDIPKNPAAKTQATRELYVQEILSRQLTNGGFSLTGGTMVDSKGDAADPDITAMALQALAKYQSTPGVKAATDRAIACLANLQLSNGGFSTWGEANLESVVQVVVALTELGIPLNDSRFVKNGNTIVDTFMSFYKKGSGFLHTSNGSGSAQMSTEQGLYALAAINRAESGKPSLYRMSDVTKLAGQHSGDASGSGLPGKHSDVKAMPITSPAKTFDDISGHKNQPAIEALAAREIITGKSDISFDPDATMTRAEFATIVTRGLGLAEKPLSVFLDVPNGIWYDGYVGTAYTYGIVNGTSATTFNPNGTLTRAEAAVMVARAAKLCGMNTYMTELEARDILAQFGDYMTLPAWAWNSVAFCYDEGILTLDRFDINHSEHVNRAEISEMLFRMLGAARLV